VGLVAAMTVNSGMRSAPAIDAVPPGEPEHALAIKGCSVQVGVGPLFGKSLSTRVTGSTRAIAFCSPSVTQAASSGPTMTPWGAAPGSSAIRSDLPVPGSKAPVLRLEC